jgi:hypothetical protein
MSGLQTPFPTIPTNRLALAQTTTAVTGASSPALPCGTWRTP